MTASRTTKSFEDIQGIRSVQHLAYVLGIKKRELLSLAKNTEAFYKPFTDRRGKKPRQIDNPSPYLKKVHKLIKNKILKHYPIFEGSYGGVKGKSIRDNAFNHVGKDVVIRLDLSNCFHSIKAKAVQETFRKNFKYSNKVSQILTKIITYKGSIPVGSPLSSTLVNITLDDTWRRAKAVCKKRGHTLTVWVDDIVVSGPSPEKLINAIKKLVNLQRLKIGWHKLDIMRSNVLQEVTGCTVNTKLGVSKVKRRKYAETIRRSINKGKITGQITHTSFINHRQGRQLRKLLTRQQKPATTANKQEDKTTN